MKNKVTRYILYAIGEIILVVIGILIALQVNNANDESNKRSQESKYLKNIKLDLEKDIQSLKFNTDFRERRVEATRKLIDHINGTPVTDITDLTNYIGLTIWEERFAPSNVTYKDLVGSGNLNLISNDSIKHLLFELELLYQTNDFFIDHETFDYRQYISIPIFQETDVQRIWDVMSGKKSAAEFGSKMSDFELLLARKEYKNGCVIINATSTDFINYYDDVRKKSESVIRLIDEDLAE